MRLIDADELYKKFIDGESDTEQERSANQLARYLIRHASSVDAVPAENGHWENITRARVDDTGFCSVCRKEAVWRTKLPYPKCPYCGAKMDGGKNNENQT